MRRFAILMCAGALALGTAAVPAAATPERDFGRAALAGFASLPAQTYVPGSERSGAQLGTAPVNGITPPFPGQPVQGFSGIARRHDGGYDVLSDTASAPGPTAPTSCCACTTCAPTSGRRS
ncbi:hypothetical protein [Nonomuraea endophytica]|uniref:Uncharacterized protein n=1 Tax=Nonomuraea endophytica TaxID=714136 RepID=A0A7W8AEI2_9ACTN|nr:hypothetical protein [Nonomuraea endophytica]MBB5084184.1 hypothetical protein [Nonomuraea endophytica]